MIGAIAAQMAELDRELRRLARDRRLLALQTISGVGPIVACHLLAEIADARRFRPARQLVRVAGLDPVVHDSADSKRRGKLSKQGSPQLRWMLVQPPTRPPVEPAASTRRATSRSASGSAASGALTSGRAVPPAPTRSTALADAA